MFNINEFKVGDIVVVKKYMNYDKEDEEMEGLVGKINLIDGDVARIEVTDFCAALFNLKYKEVFAFCDQDTIKHFEHTKGDAKAHLSISYDTLRTIAHIAIKRGTSVQEMLENMVKFF